MAQDRDSKIRARAHAIWLEEGSPTGRHEEHWERAVREIDGAPVGEKSDPIKKPRAKPAPRKGTPASGKVATKPTKASKPAEAAAQQPKVPAGTKKAAPTS